MKILEFIQPSPRGGRSRGLSAAGHAEAELGIELGCKTPCYVQEPSGSNAVGPPTSTGFWAPCSRPHLSSLIILCSTCLRKIFLQETDLAALADDSPELSVVAGGPAPWPNRPARQKGLHGGLSAASPGWPLLGDFG